VELAFADTNMMWKKTSYLNELMVKVNPGRS